MEGTLTEKVWIDLNQKAKELRQEEQRQNQILTEERERRQIEANKPEIKYAKVWNFKSVYPDELTTYIQTYNLAELETYLQALRDGAYYEDFKNGTVISAMSYLAAQLKIRRDKSAKPKDA